MEINRTNLHAITSGSVSKSGDRNQTAFPKAEARTENEPGVPGLPPGITRADLRDPQKSEQILRSCFAGMVDQSSEAQGAALSTADRDRVADFLASDPITRAKLLSHFEQIVK